MSLGNVNKLYNIAGTSFNKVYIKMRLHIRFFLSHDFLPHTDSLLDTFYTVFSLIATRAISD